MFREMARVVIRHLKSYVGPILRSGQTKPPIYPR
jgi:hypothetical protein